MQRGGGFFFDRCSKFFFERGAVLGGVKDVQALEQGGNIEVKGAFVIFPNSWGVLAQNLICAGDQVKLPAVSALCGLSVRR